MGLSSGRLGRSLAVSLRSVRASYKPLYTQRLVVGAKQGLTNQCRRGRIGHSILAAHDRYRFRPARRGFAVSRLERNPPNLPQRRLYAGSTVSFGTRARSLPWVRRSTRPSAHD